MSAVAGLRGTGDFGTDERPKSFRENILFMRPNGTSPIFGLTSKAKTITKTDAEFSWWAETQTIIQLQAAGAHLSTDQIINVDSLDPDDTAMGRNYGTAKHLKPGDLLMVEPAADAVSLTYEILRVREAISDTQLLVTRGACGTTPAAIADDRLLLAMGSAYAEGTGIPPATTRNPVKFMNLIQIFKDTYELTGTVDATTFRTGNAWSNDKKRKMFDHAQKIEHAILYGRRSETLGENGKPMRTMGGLRSMIPATNQTVFGVPATFNTLMDAISPVFDFSTDAGNTRLAFGGNTALMNINKLFKADGSVRVNFDKKITMYGLDFTEFVMPRGRILFYSHPLLSRDSIFNKGMYLLDFSNISYVTMKGRDTRVRDDVQTKSEDVRRGFIQTDCSLLVDAGGLSQGYIGNITVA
jgi:hypothetical protein